MEWEGGVGVCGEGGGGGHLDQCTNANNLSPGCTWRVKLRVPPTPIPPSLPALLILRDVMLFWPESMVTRRKKKTHLAPLA